MQPNILYIHSHDTGRYSQPYGHAIPTPRLQQLAEQGILFRQAFCAAPTCSPSRAALLTGRWPHCCGMLGLTHRGFGLTDDDYSPHLVNTLKAAGYASALVGVQHVSRVSTSIGYDEVLTVQRDQPHHVAAAAVDYIIRQSTVSPGRPFFLDVGFGETHRGFRAPGPDEDARYTLPPAPLPDTPQTRADMAAFKASARHLDTSIGMVLDALETAGVSENTLVIATTDHGIAFPGMKCNLTDHGIGVMLMIRGPSGFDGGRVVDSLVSQIDIFPTVCEVAGIDRPEWLQGKSLLPLLKEEVEQINDSIFAEINFHAAYDPQRCVRTPRWKYIRRFDDRGTQVVMNCDGSPSKDCWVEQGWRERLVAGEQLYDLVFDPNESCNLVERSEYAPLLENMRQRLARWMEATDDPLLQGPLIPPPGCKLNNPDGLEVEGEPACQW